MFCRMNRQCSTLLLMSAVIFTLASCDYRNSSSDAVAADGGGKTNDASGASEDLGFRGESPDTSFGTDPDAMPAVDPDTGAPSDASMCSDDPPAFPDNLVCQTWQCDEQPAPACWTCSAVPMDDGSDCRLPDEAVGVCREGACISSSAPGQPGDFAVDDAAAAFEVDRGILPTNIPLTLYLPQEAGPFPVVIFHHGFELNVALYASYGEHLASWGYVVVMPQMPGGFIGGPNHVELKDYLIALMDWVQANAAAPDGPLQGKVDPDRIGLAGHSLGGKISLLTSSADPRPIAVFGIDPVDAAGGPIPMPEEQYPSVTPERMNQIVIPIGLVGETTNATCEGFGCQACAPEDNNFHQYYEHAASPALEIEIIGANHMSFLDNPNCGLLCTVCSAGMDDPNTTRMLTQRYMTAFFNVFLREDMSFLRYLTGVQMEQDIAAERVLSTSRNGF